MQLDGNNNSTKLTEGYLKIGKLPHIPFPAIHIELRKALGCTNDWGNPFGSAVWNRDEGSFTYFNTCVDHQGNIRVRPSEDPEYTINDLREKFRYRGYTIEVVNPDSALS